MILFVIKYNWYFKLLKLNITAQFTKKDIEKHINNWLNKVDDAVLLALQKVGETFITNARSNKTYKDQTGNLRSSIGYVILKNGFQYFGGDFVLIRKRKKKSQKKLQIQKILWDCFN